MRISNYSGWWPNQHSGFFRINVVSVFAKHPVFTPSTCCTSFALTVWILLWTPFIFHVHYKMILDYFQWYYSWDPWTSAFDAFTGFCWFFPWTKCSCPFRFRRGHGKNIYGINYLLLYEPWLNLIKIKYFKYFKLSQV